MNQWLLSVCWLWAALAPPCPVCAEEKDCGSFNSIKEVIEHETAAISNSFDYETLSEAYLS